MNLKITNIQISSYVENEELPSLQYLADKLCEDNDIEYVTAKSKAQASLEKIDTTNISSIYTKLKEYPYEFEINGSLQLASIDGISTESNNIAINQYGYFVYPDLSNKFGLYKFNNSSSRNIDMRVCERNGVNAIVLEKGITYNLNFSIRPYCKNSFQIEYGLYDITENKFIVSNVQQNISWCNFYYQQTYTPTENKYVVYACNLQGNAGEEYIVSPRLTITTQTKNVDNVKFNSVNISSSRVNPTIKEMDNNLEHSNNTITLEENKTYKLTYQIIVNPGNEYGNYGLWNFTDNCSIDSQTWTSGNENYKNIETIYSAIYTTTKRTEIGLYAGREGGSTDAQILEGTNLKIESIE